MLLILQESWQISKQWTYTYCHYLKIQCENDTKRPLIKNFYFKKWITWNHYNSAVSRYEYNALHKFIDQIRPYKNYNGYVILSKTLKSPYNRKKCLFYANFKYASKSVVRNILMFHSPWKLIKCKINSQWEFAVWLRELKLGLCNNLEVWEWAGAGREIPEGGNICIPIVNSLGLQGDQTSQS